MVESDKQAGAPEALAPATASRPTRRISPTALADAARVSMIGLFVLALVVALRAASELLVPLTTALVVALVLNPLAARLERRGIPGFGVAALMMAAIGLFLYAGTYAFSSPMQAWAKRLPALVSALYQHAMALRASLLHQPMTAGSAADGAKQLLDLVGSTGILSSAALTAPSVLGAFALFAVALFFLIGLRARLRAGLLSLFIKRRNKITAAHILRDIEKRVSAYLATIACINVGVGVVAAATMWVLGVPNPTLWGALATLLNFAPYLGPAVTVAIIAGVGLTTFHTILTMLAPPLAMAAIFFIEGNLITPSVIGHRFTLNPLMVLVSLSFWLWLWGPIGAVLAVPLLIIGITVFTYVALPHLAERAIEERRRESRTRRRRHRPITPIEPPPRTAGAVKVPAPPHL